MSLLSKIFGVALVDNSDGLQPWRTTRRIYVSADVLKANKVCAGDPVALVNVQSESSDEKCFAVGIAWPSLDTPSDKLEAHPSAFLTSRLLEGARARLVPLAGGTKIPTYLPLIRLAQDAVSVQLREVDPRSEDIKPVKQGDTSLKKTQDWLTMLLRECLVDINYITKSQIVQVTYEGRARRFAIESINGSVLDEDESLSLQLAKTTLADSPSTTAPSRPQLWTVTWDTTVSLATPSSTAKTESESTDAQRTEPSVIPATEDPADAYASVGGLDAQITQIRELLELPLTQPLLFRRFGLKPPRGLLLHGPPGTGKTHLARAVAQASQAQVILVNGPELSGAFHGETEGRLRKVFEEAHTKSPCVIVLDELDALCPARDEGSAGEVERRVVATLLTLMDGFSASSSTSGEASRVVVVATTNRPNAIDSALRRPGRFDIEIEIGIPDAQARLSILRALLAHTPCSASSDELANVAGKAHGYVGADLGAVVREAGMRALRRWLASSPTGTYPSPAKLNSQEDGADPEVTASDLLGALPTVRASALRTLQAHGGDAPRVTFADVGGLAPVIQALRECVEWPLKHPEAFARLGVKAPRSVLLYGPPGCSKTLLVRALASESAVNFVAIKGPELLSKYVGDSERAVRELFRKARAAAPCIVFFDEVDALASARGENNSSSASEGVLISLLTEMDGAREMGAGVTVVGATNRPEALDGALLRPGRLDRLVYVGPPNQDGRADILRIRMRGMKTSSDVNVEKIAQMTNGCSGAELGALCQEAALLTMRKDLDAPHVPQEAFVQAASKVSRQITPEVLAGYERWKRSSGAASAY